MIIDIIIGHTWPVNKKLGEIMPFSDKLRQLRKNAKLTQVDLAVRLNMGIRTIRRYEAGTSAPSMASLAKISEFFQVNTDYLMGLSEFRGRSDDPAPPLPVGTPVQATDSPEARA